MFGGWANDWLDDLYMLDVSGIVGPPYAVQKLVPNEGPMTGKTEIIINGLQFYKAKIVVKFTDGRNEEISEKAEYISPTEIRCQSPDWSKYSPGEVDVRVSIGGEGLTVNKIKWNYYVNTKPQKCIAYGPGLFEKGCVWGFPAVFKIQAKDTAGRNRTSGGEVDRWKVKIHAGGTHIHAKIVDNKDGTYDCSYIPRTAEPVDISIAYDDPVQGSEVVIRGSPWKATFENPWSKCKMQGNPPKILPGVSVTTLMKRLVFFNGTSGGGDVTKRVHVLDADQLKWESPDVEGHAPQDRLNYSFTTLDNEKMLIYGGRKPPESEQQPFQADFSDIHVLIFEKGSWKWAPQSDVAGDVPAVRASHAACLIPVGKKVVVFGGVSSEGALRNDVQILTAQNIAKMDWMSIPLTPSKQVPAADIPAEASAASAEPEAAPKAVDQIEKEEDGESKDETAEEEVEKPRPHMTAPGKRKNTGIVVIEGKVYLFGGVATHDNNEDWFTSILSVGIIAIEKGGNQKTIEKGDDITWSNLEVKGDIPGPRSDFTMTVLDGKILLHGGVNEKGNNLDDMYTFDIESGEWSCLYASDGSMIPQNTLNAFVQKRLFSISGSRSLYDDVRVLEFGKISEQNAFYPKMAARVAEELEQLHKFESESLANMSIDPNKGETEEKQRDLLLKVNSCIYDFKMKAPSIELQLDVLKDTIGLLSKNGINMEKMESQMTEAVDKWGSVKKQAPVAKDLGKLVQEREALKIKKNIENFENRVKTYAFEFSKKPLFDFATGVDAAYTNVIKVREELLRLDVEMADLASYARIFEFPDLIDPAKAVQERCHSELQMTLQLWHMIDFINFQLSDWKKTLWNDINCEVI